MIYKGEKEIVEYLQKKKISTVNEIAADLSFNADLVRKAVESLRSKEFVKITEEENVVLVPTEEYRAYVSVGFPEESVFIKANKGAKISELTEQEKNIGVRWAKLKGFIEIEKGALKALKNYDDVKNELDKLRGAFAEISKTGKCGKLIEEELFRRKLVEKRVFREERVNYTGEGRKMEAIEKAGIDLNVVGPNAEIGKPHPISMFAMKIAGIMAELGFEEMEGGILQSAFWNFDALFQPQDHPARELADTFYIDKKTALPEDKELVKRVKKAHEKGWNMEWDEKIAQKTVLRTHTTALSAKYLANIKERKPKKYFAIGRVFRNEATDYKHLAEFHQIEGIIVWDKASFRDLLGILKEIYNKLGFEKIRFRPSYFPYTEPSLEIEVYYDDRKQWMELGGAGIFRPEVSLPLCGVYPVLAWGLSLERPLMLSLNIDDIREFYKNDIAFLKNTRSKL